MTRSSDDGASRPEIRAGFIRRKKRLLSSFPSPQGAADLAVLESCAAFTTDGGMLGEVLLHIDPAEARQFNFRNDPTNSRVFLISENDELTEITQQKEES